MMYHTIITILTIHVFFISVNRKKQADAIPHAIFKFSFTLLAGYENLFYHTYCATEEKNKFIRNKSASKTALIKVPRKLQFSRNFHNKTAFCAAF